MELVGYLNMVDIRWEVRELRFSSGESGSTPGVLEGMF